MDTHPVRIDGDQLLANIDPAKVERIIENLLVNAARHTPGGTPVHVSVGASDDGIVLVVEDEAQVRDFTCQVLASHGYQCVEATNGLEAFNIMRKRGEHIAAVVTDVVMPGLGGGALARRIAELQPTLPVLFTSAYSSEEMVRRGLIPPGAPFLQKPFTPEALIARLRDFAQSGVLPESDQ